MHEDARVVTFDATIENPADRRRPTPKRKRDSLRRRHSHGQPGSRRYQRWLNEQEMYRAFDSAMLSNSHDDDDSLVPLLENKPTPLTHLHENQDLTKVFRACLEASLLPKPHIKSRTRKVITPQSQYNSIDSRIKPLLRRFYVYPFVTSFLRDIDEIISAFVHGFVLIDSPERDLDQWIYKSDLFESHNNPPTNHTVNNNSNSNSKANQQKDCLVLDLKDSFHRLLSHGICQFYGLVATSEDINADRRVTVIRRSKKTVTTTVSFFEYLSHIMAQQIEAGVAQDD
eukprot:GILJ01004885.1.p1 GENE.GILJ01004885.1~~GILJ01004885.1.p1  ORF type:complete len:334 (+),score=54.22 GILJ01004885.1:148-1002(+)